MGQPVSSTKLRGELRSETWPYMLHPWRSSVEFVLCLHHPISIMQGVYMSVCCMCNVEDNHHLDFPNVSAAWLVLILTVMPWWTWGIVLNSRGLINMINSGATAQCNLQLIGTFHTYLQSRVLFIMNSFHSLICGQQQEPGLADLLGLQWSALSRTQLLVQPHWIDAHTLFSAGDLSHWAPGLTPMEGSRPGSGPRVNNAGPVSMPALCPPTTSLHCSDPAQVWWCSLWWVTGSVACRVIVAATDQWQKD